MLRGSDVVEWVVVVELEIVAFEAAAVVDFGDWLTISGGKWEQKQRPTSSYPFLV